MTEDHPRVCGEQFCPALRKWIPAGSPPRVRGTVSTPWIGNSFSRITPACAGNRCTHCYPLTKIKDHPRVCGEQRKNYPELWALMGSPPRVRGTVYHIPCIHRLPGSPPRVRGTVCEGYFTGHIARITPACAGNSFKIIRCVHVSKDHPRVCGEQSCMNFFYTCNKGSPPRVRGTVTFRNIVGVYVRITPACAGNSRQLAQQHHTQRDHPRVCGEQPSCMTGSLT